MSSPTQKRKLRAAEADYFWQSERHEPDIHYGQIRRMRTLRLPPWAPRTADCSEYATCGPRWAQTMTGIAFPDPNGNDYSGVGNTSTLIAVNREHEVPLTHTFFVGDMAFYRDEAHVTICRIEGSYRTAVFSSHGREAGPVPTQLWSYRRDELLYVLRPKALL